MVCVTGANGAGVIEERDRHRVVAGLQISVRPGDGEELRIDLLDNPGLEARPVPVIDLGLEVGRGGGGRAFEVLREFRGERDALGRVGRGGTADPSELLWGRITWPIRSPAVSVK